MLTRIVQKGDFGGGNTDNSQATNNRLASHSGLASHIGMHNHIRINIVGDAHCTSDRHIGTTTQDDQATDWIDIDMNDASTSHRHAKVRDIDKCNAIQLMPMSFVPDPK